VNGIDQREWKYNPTVYSASKLSPTEWENGGRVRHWFLSINRHLGSSRLGLKHLREPKLEPSLSKKDTNWMIGAGKGKLKGSAKGSQLKRRYLVKGQKKATTRGEMERLGTVRATKRGPFQMPGGYSKENLREGTGEFVGRNMGTFRISRAKYPSILDTNLWGGGRGGGGVLWGGGGWVFGGFCRVTMLAASSL